MSSNVAGALAVLDRGIAAVVDVVEDAALSDAGVLDLLREVEVRCRRLGARHQHGHRHPTRRPTPRPDQPTTGTTAVARRALRHL